MTWVWIKNRAYQTRILSFPIGALSMLPWWPSGKESACQCRRLKRHMFNPWVEKIPWRGKWQPTPVFLPEKSNGQMSLECYTVHGVIRVRHNWATNTLTNMECVLLIFFLISLNTKHNIGYMVFNIFIIKNSIADNSIQPQLMPLCHCPSHTIFLKHWSSFNSLLPIPVHMLCPFLIPYKITHPSHITLNNNSFEAFP